MCMFFLCMGRFPLDTLVSFPWSKDIWIRSAGYFKLLIGVNVNVNGCPEMDWLPVQGVLIGSSFPMNSL